MIDDVASRLPDAIPIPSLTRVKTSFYPHNPYNKAAIAYIGKFRMVQKIQMRLAHVSHVDREFVYTLFDHLKHMAVRYSTISKLVSVDNKRVIPVGEPSAPISTGVRPHNRSLVPQGVNIVASDHDFHVAGVVPSVDFAIDIPYETHGSFHKGTVYVTLKDKVFESSSPERHTAETVQIMRNVFSQNNVDLDQPLMFIMSDGGPDHRVIYSSVQLG